MSPAKQSKTLGSSWQLLELCCRHADIVLLNFLSHYHSLGVVVPIQSDLVEQDGLVEFSVSMKIEYKLPAAAANIER
jgi:hypothetical protein